MTSCSLKILLANYSFTNHIYIYNLALDNLQKLICHKIQPINQPTNFFMVCFVYLFVPFFHLIPMNIFHPFYLSLNSSSSNKTSFFPFILVLLNPIHNPLTEKAIFSYERLSLLSDGDYLISRPYPLLTRTTLFIHTQWLTLSCWLRCCTHAHKI